MLRIEYFDYIGIKSIFPMNLSEFKNSLLKKAQKEDSNNLTVSIQGKKLLITQYTSKVSGWKMVSISELSEIKKTVNQSISHMVIVFLLIAMVIFLVAQINPHFIYNTLNSISWLAVFNGQTQVKEHLSNLTTLLRSAYSNPEQLVALENEKKYLICYTDIMKLRYDNFTLLFEEMPGIGRCMIPKCTLQPIVENSIIHGFPNINHPCIIRIRFEKQQEMLQISIKNLEICS